MDEEGDGVPIAAQIQLPATGGAGRSARSRASPVVATDGAGGNFRLLHRLFAQIERLLAVNNIAAVTTDVVAAAVRASSSAAPLTNVQLSAN